MSNLCAYQQRQTSSSLKSWKKPMTAPSDLVTLGKGLGLFAGKLRHICLELCCYETHSKTYGWLVVLWCFTTGTGMSEQLYSLFYPYCKSAWPQKLCKSFIKKKKKLKRGKTRKKVKNPRKVIWTSRQATEEQKFPALGQKLEKTRCLWRAGMWTQDELTVHKQKHI